MSVRFARQEIEARESESLAAYAARSADSRGRAYPQPEHTLRTAYQRDRDRIIHSSAFRRMEYKTQVFIPHERDHFRTRLTHTIEVAQISRTIARNLRLNEDLAEAIALVHDLGHTPFGHSGEEVLDRLLSDCGGFNHNRQSLRIVDLLEQRYAEHPGLNLTYEVREGIIKHETSADISMNEFNPHEQPTLEASLVDIADEIAYNSHDIDDGISSGILTTGMLGEVEFIEALTGLKISSSEQPDHSRDLLVRAIIDRAATDLIEETSRRLEENNIGSLEDVRRSPEKIVACSPAVAKGMKELKQFLSTNLYRHEKMKTMSEWAGEIIQTLFARISSDPSLMSPRYQKRLERDRPEIVIADYIAGMTDRFATQLYERLD